MAEPIKPGERRELRSVVRQQFRVLRAEVKQRKLEMISEAETRLVERYRDEDKQLEDLNWRAQQIAEEAQRQIHDLMREHGDGSDGGAWHTWSGRIEFRKLSRFREDRAQLHRALEAGIREQVDTALLALDRQEADLLKQIAMEGLESEEAIAFLARIPTVAELVPEKRLREIEASFDKGRATG